MATETFRGDGFNYESRWNEQTHSFIGQVGITCRKCHRTEWATAKNPGWGRRIFKEKGWLLGPTRARDVCPGCMAQQPHRQLTPAAKRAAYARIENLPRKQQLELTTSINKEPLLPPAPFESLMEPQKMAEALSNLGEVTVVEKKPAPGIPMPPERMAKRGGPPGAVGTHGFSNSYHASKAAERYLISQGLPHPRGDEHYVVEKTSSGYRWRILPFDLEAAKLAPPPMSPRPRSDSKTNGFTTEFAAARSARNFVRRLGIDDPQPYVHYKVEHEPGKGWRWALVNLPAPVLAPKPPSAIVAPDVYKFVMGAMRNAIVALQKEGVADPAKGVDFQVVKVADGYVWRRTADVKPDDVLVQGAGSLKAEWIKMAQRGPKGSAPSLDYSDARGARRAAFIEHYRAGIEDARANVHYRVERTPQNRYAWKPLPASPLYKQPEPPQQPQGAVSPAEPTENTPMDITPSMTEPKVEPPRTPTRAHIRTILNFLEDNYDVEKERWRGDMNDERAASKLDMPRAWITTERERGYGPNASEGDHTRALRWYAEMVKEAATLADQAMELAAKVEAFKVRLEKFGAPPKML